MTISPPIKWHGGKHYLASRFWDIAEPILSSVIHCVEPYCGGCAWTLEGLARGHEKSFVVNDLNWDLMNFWEVLADENKFWEMSRVLQATPFAEMAWVHGGTLLDHSAHPVKRATGFFIRCRQSLAGRMQSFAPLSRTRTRRGMNEQASAWLSAIEGLPEIHNLLKRVVILNRPALEVIRSQDGPKTLFYIDPPYLHETRNTTEEYGQFEMSYNDHLDLLNVIRECKGRVMISGYENELYDSELGSWPSRYEFDLPNNAAAGKTKDRETEVLWTNF